MTVAKFTNIKNRYPNKKSILDIIGELVTETEVCFNMNFSYDGLEKDLRLLKLLQDKLHTLQPYGFSSHASVLKSFKYQIYEMSTSKGLPVKSFGFASGTVKIQKPISKTWFDTNGGIAPDTDINIFNKLTKGKRKKIEKYIKKSIKLKNTKHISW